MEKEMKESVDMFMMENEEKSKSRLDLLLTLKEKKTLEDFEGEKTMTS